MRLRSSRKIWRVHEGHDFEASSQFKPPNASKLNPPNFTGSPNQFSTREITTIKFQQVIPISNKVHDPQSASARPMSRARLIAGISTRGKFPMEGRQNLSSEGGTGSTLRRADQVFSLKAYSTAAESSGTARITRKTGARTAVIWGTTRIARSGRGRSSMESADSALRQNDAIVRS